MILNTFWTDNIKLEQVSQTEYWETTFLPINQFCVDLGLDQEGFKYLTRSGSKNTSFGSKTLHKEMHRIILDFF